MLRVMSLSRNGTKCAAMFCADTTREKICDRFKTRVSTRYSDSALGTHYLVEDLLGFRPGVFPGVFLLSRRR